MAFLAKTLHFFFLLVLISSLQIQARESKFFNKFTHISVKSKVIPECQISQIPTSAPALAPTPSEAVPTIAAEPVTAPVLAPTPAEAVPTIAAEPVTALAEAPVSFYAESENGYGLYGHGYGQFPPTKETLPSTTNENDLFNEELSSENYETGYRNSNYNNNYNAHGYVTEKQGMSDTRYMQNYRNSNNNNEYTNDNKYNNGYTNDNNENKYTNVNNYNNNVYASNYNNNGYSSNYNADSYETEKKGMSDTRFLENGKYYYDVENENSYSTNRFASQRETATNQGYYGNGQNENEFNTMEEFENEKNEP